MRTLADVWVSGTPRPKGSMVHIGQGRMQNQSGHTARWQRIVSDVVGNDMLWRGARRVDADVAVLVGCVFFMPERSSVDNAAPPIVSGIGDVDKLTRCVLDALTGIAYVDDVQVVQVRASRMWARGPMPAGALVVATALDANEWPIWSQQSVLEAWPRYQRSIGGGDGAGI